MNRGQGLFSLSIQARLTIAVVTAVIAPVLILALWGYSNTINLNLQNLESYIAESGVRRQQAIENDFRTAINVVNAFISNPANQSDLVVPLISRRQNSPETRQLITQATELLDEELLSTGWFRSGWLLTADGVDLTPITAGQVSQLQIKRLQTDSTRQIFAASSQIQTTDNTTPQLLVIVEQTDGYHIEVISPLIGEVTAGRASIIGYLVLDLDLDKTLINNLVIDHGELDTYAYLMIPGTTDYFADEDTQQFRTIDVRATGPQRILTSDTTGIATYSVGIEENRRDVIGHYTPVFIENQRFGLVTEIESDVVESQLQNILNVIIFPLVVGVLLLIGFVIIGINQLAIRPIFHLREAIRSMMLSDYDMHPSLLNRDDEIGLLAASFIDVRQQVQTLIHDMEERLQARMRDVRVTQDISRTVTAERDLNTLMKRVVDMIVENFPSIYHAQIFLLDSAREYAVLRASTGEIGERLLERRHKLAVGSVSVIGQTTEQGQVIITRDTGESDVHRRNEFLKDTLAELAIPLQLGGTIIGALDVQSKERDAFDEDQVGALQSLADQVTIAIENARLFEESARLLRDIEQDRRATTQFTWQQYMNSSRTKTISKQTGVQTKTDFSELRQAVYRHKQSVVGKRTDHQTIPFAVPILLRGEILGVSQYEIPEDEFTHDKVLLAEELVSRLAISLDNARLFQESQQSAERERMVNEISTKLTSQADIETIIETAIHEVGQVLRTKQVAIRLRNQEASNHHEHAQADLDHPDNPSY